MLKSSTVCRCLRLPMWRLHAEQTLTISESSCHTEWAISKTGILLAGPWRGAMIERHGWTEECVCVCLCVRVKKAEHKEPAGTAEDSVHHGLVFFIQLYTAAPVLCTSTNTGANMQMTYKHTPQHTWKQGAAWIAFHLPLIHLQTTPCSTRVPPLFTCKQFSSITFLRCAEMLPCEILYICRHF